MDLTAELKDKVVVVSGGSRGIGFATVKKFLSYGAKVCFLSIMKRPAPRRWQS